MKKLPPLVFAALLALSTAGQWALAEPGSSFGLAPSAPPPVDPASPAAGLPLIPDSLTPPDKSAKPGEPPKGADKTALAEDKLRKRIQIRQAEAKAERDPELQAIKARAAVAPTFYEQRNLYIDYYTKLCDRMAVIDKTILKADIETMKNSYTSRFIQNHIAPTIAPDVARAQHN